jgi:hypothetical protein
LKLWRISQTVNDDYDTFDSAVVAATTEEEARITYPSHFQGPSPRKWNGKNWLYTSLSGEVLSMGHRTWTTPNFVDVEFLADGYEGPAGTICASFNAG